MRASISAVLGPTCLLLLACGVPDPGLAPPDQGFQIDEGQFMVRSGANVDFCQEYPMPDSYGYGPQYIVGVKASLPRFTHHYFMSYAEEEIGAAQPCKGDSPIVDLTGGENPHTNNGKIIFIAGEGSDEFQLPEGYGIYLPTGRGKMITSHHVLNTSTEDQMMSGLVNVYTRDRSLIHHPVNALNCVLTDLVVPANSEKTVSGTCLAPWDLDLVILGSHAHQHLLRFEMRIFDGEKTLPDPIYTSSDWDSPVITPLQKPIHLQVGQGVTFSCLYKNPNDVEMTFGTGDTKDMCAIMSAYAYPAEREDDIPPTLGTVIYRESATVLLFDTTNFEGPF